ncbi:MAG: TrkH family potassium uptake protein [Candidatus Algichlamydia australiensis]|nr:TrkH family potassium uptake protein [Chlamydiales bacterium]
MRWRDLCKLISNFLLLFSAVLLIPIGVSIYFEFFQVDPLHPPYLATVSFIGTLGISFGLALLLRFIGRKTEGQLYRRESLLLVPIVWIITSVISALPFVFTGTIKEPINALFESVSGLTTTGATIIYPKAFDNVSHEEVPVTTKSLVGKEYQFNGTITPLRTPDGHEIILEGLDAVSKPILFWRSFMQWIGGLGIIFLFIAIFPALAIGGKFLYEAEITGPFKEALTPRIKETASYLWKIYLGLSLLEILCLRVFNHSMPLFDAITITFSNISTGGFSIHEKSIGFYNHHPTEWIVMLFMFLGAINFSLIFFALRGKLYRLFDPELLLFLGVIISSAAIISILLFRSDFASASLLTEVSTYFDKLRTSLFQFLSSITSTGFFTANYDLWPWGAQSVMLLSMFIGGMSGSTAGGIKMVRHLISFRTIKHKIESLFRPEAVRALKIRNREIPMKTVTSVFIFFWVVIVLAAIATLLLVLDGIDPRTSFGLIACSINNVGLSFDAAGPMSTCAFMPAFSKIVMILCMLLGRLEFYAFLIILTPRFWKSR